jgi:hypothetical protein
VSMPPPLHGTLPHAPCAVRSTCMRLQTVRARPSGPTPTIFCYCFVYRIKNQIAKKGHSMTNRIEVTKDQALEVSCRCARLLQRCRGFWIVALHRLSMALFYCNHRCSATTSLRLK